MLANCKFARNHLNIGAVNELLQVTKADDVMVHIASHLISPKKNETKSSQGHKILAKHVHFGNNSVV